MRRRFAGEWAGLVLSLSLWAACGTGAAIRAQDAPGLQCPPEPLPVFSATLDGRPLELHGFRSGSFAIFAEAGHSEIVIHAGFDVRWVDVRPLSAQVVYGIGPNHRDIRVAIKDATPLTVEFNDDLGQVVHLFPYKAEEGDVHVRGPRVHYFGPGIHEAGLIELKSDETVYLAAGAWVKGMIRARGARNVSIVGHGVLDASENAKGNGGNEGQSPILLEETQDARIEGITIFNSHEWTVHLRQADRTRIDGIRILNPGEWNGDDGIDIDSSSHVTVENIFVRTGDDCVVVKNMADVETRDNAALRCILEAATAELANRGSSPDG